VYGGHAVGELRTLGCPRAAPRCCRCAGRRGWRAAPGRRGARRGEERPRGVGRAGLGCGQCGGGGGGRRRPCHSSPPRPTPALPPLTGEVCARPRNGAAGAPRRPPWHQAAARSTRRRPSGGGLLDDGRVGRRHGGGRRRGTANLPGRGSACVSRRSVECTYWFTAASSCLSASTLASTCYLARRPSARSRPPAPCRPSRRSRHRHGDEAAERLRRRGRGA